MKKKVLLAVAAAMAITSVSFASPLSNYEKGSVAIDLNTMISPDVKERIHSEKRTQSYDAKSRLGAGITYGIGDKLALQYKYSDNKTKDYYYDVPASEDYNRDFYQLTGHEFNVLYQFDPNVSSWAIRDQLQSLTRIGRGRHGGMVVEVAEIPKMVIKSEL